MAEYADSTTSGVYDVDCTSGGESLCSKHGVKGYPSIKYGDPNELKDYEGGRSYEDLKKFASENLGPSCGPDHMDLCSAEDKTRMEKYLAMSVERLEAKILKVNRDMEIEMPVMKKVVGHLKKAKSEL